MKLKNPYSFFNEFCLRTPILPIDFYFELTKDKEILSEKFKEIWKDHIIQEAIFLASPNLYDQIEKWMRGEITDIQKIKRLKFSLLKYISRMSSRCTPFGIFSGCSIGKFGNSTNIKIQPPSKNQRQTRFDMNFLVAFSLKLSEEEYIKNQLLWFPNNSLYRIGNQYRYIEYSYNQNNIREHSIEAVSYTPYLETILKNSKSGKKIRELASLIVDSEISIEEAESFINLLIKNQILVSELEPSVTGRDFLVQINHTLNKIKNTNKIVNTINHFQNCLNNVDQYIGNNIQKYIDLSNTIKEQEITFDPKYLFQTDMYTKTFDNQLHVSFAYKIKRAMSLLNRISLPRENGPIEQFKKAFLNRYETKEIPLATALDTEIGIGYLQNQDANDFNPIIENIMIPSKKESQVIIYWDAVQDILHKKLLVAYSNNDYKIELTEDDFSELELNWKNLPDTMSALIEIVSVDGIEKIVMPSIGGSSAANLLGRFSTGNTEILNHVQNIADTEQKILSDKILAEITHLPESRTGNVIRRAAIRDYEIPYLGKSSLPKENQIEVDDLMVSVRHNRIILRSKKHNKEVFPKLTNAHNYSGNNALPIYRMLCDLQQQNDRTHITFHWGELLRKNTFLPRVEYQNIIFSKAKWIISKESFKALIESNDKEKDLPNIVTLWRKKLQIPQYVQLIESDNTLLINLKNITSIQMLLDAIKRKKSFVLEEFLFTEKSIVQNDNKNHTNQFVVSFFNKEKIKSFNK